MYNIYYLIKLKSTSTKTQNILFTCVHQVESTHQWLRLRNRRVSSFIRGVRISPSYGFFVKKKIPRVLPYYSSLFIFFFFFYPPEVFIGCHGDIRVDGPSPCKGVYYRPGKRCLRCSKRTMLQEFEVGQLKEDAASRCSLSQIACNNCFLSFVKSLRIVLEFSFFFSLSFSLLYLLEMGL